jgi:arylsulfatase A-like enzyme
VRPNFVFILADDLGYADLGCYGGRVVAGGGAGDRATGSAGAAQGSCSPMLDRMAAEGLRFTEGYANSSVCSPTRFALMTGRWQHRLRGGADEPISSRSRGSNVLGLPPAHPTLPSLLRDAGYATALVGKWHLGYPPHFHPLKSGYQEFFGALSGGMDYFTHKDTAGVHDLWDGEAEVHRTGYLTDLISERGVAYVKRARAPFLLSLHYNAPHWPWETRADEAEARRIEKIWHTDGGSVRAYQTMIRHMDEGVGAVLAGLPDPQNTLVVFTSDNGGERFSDTWPLVGKKMDLLEGGIRVPYLVRWPARVKAGGVTAQHAITMDWVATFLEAAGAKPHPDYPLDGLSLLPVLEEPQASFARDLFWRMKYRAQRAVRSGDWKYFASEDGEFLFNLAVDARERANLAKREPAKLAELRAKYEAWERSIPAIPADAAVSIPYTRADLAHPS